MPENTKANLRCPFLPALRRVGTIEWTRYERIGNTPTQNIDTKKSWTSAKIFLVLTNKIENKDDATTGGTERIRIILAINSLIDKS